MSNLRGAVAATNPVSVAPALAASSLARFPSGSDKFSWAASNRHLATLSVLVHVGIVSTPPLRLGAQSMMP